jgi:hypothetical protein
MATKKTIIVRRKPQSGLDDDVKYMKAAPTRNAKRKTRLEAAKKKAPKAPVIKGSIKDKMFPGYRLADASFADRFGIKLHDDVTTPLAVRYDAETGEVRSLTVTMPDGLKVGWLHCGVCHLYAQDCTCEKGSMEPYYITNMALRIEAEMKGEKPPTEVDLRQRNKPDVPVMPTKSFVGKDRPKSKPKADSKKGGTKRVVTRKRTNVKVDTSDIDNLDPKQLEKDATAHTEDMLSQVEQTMKGTSKRKVVRKKTTSQAPVKKVIRRKKKG